MLYVFLKNKLIGADAAAPLIVELKARWPQCSVTFVVPSRKAMEAIVQNVVLHDALRQNGCIVQIGRRQSGFIAGFRSKMSGAFWLLKTAICSMSQKTVHLHFGAFEQWPFKILFYLAPTRTLLVDSAFHGVTKYMLAFADLKSNRKVWSPLRHMSMGLVFHDQSLIRESAEELNIPCYTMSAPHEFPAWCSWLDEQSPKYFNHLRRQQPSLDRDYFFTFMLGYFGKHAFLRDSKGCVTVFEETLDIIMRNVPDIPVVFKPHAVTDMSQLARSLAKFPKMKSVICHLHPALLAARSYAVLSNYYSTTQSTAARMGVPTIEYTDYSAEANAVTGGGSIRPDHIKYFFQRDPQGLAQTLQQLTKDQARPVRFVQEPPVLDDRVFSFLATGQLPA